MIIAVDLGRKATKQTNKQNKKDSDLNSRYTICSSHQLGLEVERQKRTGLLHSGSPFFAILRDRRNIVSF